MSIIHALNRKIRIYLARLIPGLQENRNPFNTDKIGDAKRFILTGDGTISSDYRWQVETEYTMTALRRFIKNHDVICDFGIGIGRISKEILEEYKNVHIIGVDSSDKMLNLCKKNIPSNYYGRLQLIRFDRMKHIKSQSVDFIFSIYTLQHIQADLFETALKQLKRIIKPSGFIYLLNSYDRLVTTDGPGKQWYDDNLPQIDIISKYFEEVQDVKYDIEYINAILKTHFSKLFRPKLH